MTETMIHSKAKLDDFLAAATVDAEVFELRPDYRVLFLAASGIEPGAGDEHSEALLRAAEESTAEILTRTPITEVDHIAAWREAYRAFGAKPQKTRNSLEALMRRAEKGLPRINRLTDIYNAISVTHRIPLGGEDLDAYQGAPKLIRATGTEAFDTNAGGQDVTEHPDPGEVVWCDDAGVTCRRWNWRQGRRTGLRETTTSALFILDVLDPIDDDALNAAGDSLAEALATVGESVTIARRMVGAP
ncbi:phenylalanine--tRNA ligase beta subunit-related protein [Brevibacterium sp.]|uniref:B3/B4 domain-containing protein n=1 Tax=Brevibacterium sp. TaxID=1701 RepID=UPI002810BAB0|nr:phenylalanine--tRNA ligase beta subunit-related protein [Brevibacterium sp.]